MFKPCILIPTYNNPKTLGAVVENSASYLRDILVVDDGSDPQGRSICDALETSGRARVRYMHRNRGKGAAVKAGLTWAKSLGFSHALQVDADSQHDLGQISSFLDQGVQDPAVCILAYPEYDDSAPKIRRFARKFTQFWVNLEVGRGVIKDPMVGFRLYPIQATLDAGAIGERMDFDVEIAVRLAWQGVPIVNRPVAVYYPSEENGGVSHFQPFKDNLRFSWLHTRLCIEAMSRWVIRRVQRLIIEGERV
ncbi:MAG: glycosyltransferase family 2 protein [Myxococcales bacterium]|nr:glycosyltransferase family 2 protein [Myxococcales bacterium]